MLNPPDRDRAFNAYAAYVDTFRDTAGALLEMQQLKFEHSQRVAQIAQEIATAEKWHAADIILAETVGLYHDIGRYAQYRDFRTFQDLHSLDHGQHGYAVIRETAMLNFLDPADREIIETATRFHNAKFMPDNLPPVVERFLRLDRDSDKIDIYAVLAENIASKLHEKYPEILHGVSPDGPANDALIDRVLRGETLGYGESQSLSDFLVVGLQWLLNGFNFTSSYRLLQSRDVISRIAEVIKMSPKVEQLLARARQCIAQKTA